MKARVAPKCKKCGERIRGKYWNPSTFFVGDTFTGWDYRGHRCRLGLKYFIERMDKNQWWHENKKEWTTDPMLAMMFDTKESAEEYLKESTSIPQRVPCEVTEHLFIDTDKTKKV